MSQTASTPSLDRLVHIYRDLHQHPELSGQEARTSGVVGDELRRLGWTTHRRVGGYGVVGVLESGEGPTAFLRADMDALPVLEQTGLAYASRRSVRTKEEIDSPVMHACGHDVHTVALLGACSELQKRKPEWSGTVVAVFQPAEETGEGALAMIEDGLADLVPKPDVVLGQHVSAGLPVGTVGLRSGPVLAAARSIRITVHGRGGHGAHPHTTVDPAVMAAAIVMRLQSVVAREVDPTEPTVLTVGSVHVGTGPNIIAEAGTLLVNLRAMTGQTLDALEGAVRRVVAAECNASDAPQAPSIEVITNFPALVNDVRSVDGVREALGRLNPAVTVEEIPIRMSSEDFGVLGERLGAPSVFWYVGSVAPETLDGTDVARSLHSPTYAPVAAPTIAIGVEALVEAAIEFTTKGAV